MASVTEPAPPPTPSSNAVRRLSSVVFQLRLPMKRRVPGAAMTGACHLREMTAEGGRARGGGKGGEGPGEGDSATHRDTDGEGAKEEGNTTRSADERWGAERIR